MQKTAQERSRLNKLREKINVPQAHLEGFFRPELDRVMGHITKIDDQIRAELSGTNIEDASPQFPGVVKELLKAAQTNFNRREYMAGIMDLGIFHQKMDRVAQLIGQLGIEINKVHNKFLFEGLENKDKDWAKNLRQFREYMEGRKSAEVYQSNIIKEAGVMDFFHNIGTARGRALLTWEKKYPAKTQKIREGGNKLIAKANSLWAKTLDALKRMATARAIRRPDDYDDAAKSIVKDFQKFDNDKDGFKDYYKGVVAPLLTDPEISQLLKEDQGNQSSTTSPQSTSVVSVDPATKPKQEPLSMPVLPLTNPVVLDTANTPRDKPEEIKMPPRTLDFSKVRNQPPYAPSVINPEEKEPQTHQGIGRTSSLIHTLQAMSQEDPRILASVIAKYASNIQQTDPETAIKLLQIVKNIRG